MSSRGDLARRSRTEWAARIALAAVAALLGYYSITFSVAQAVADVQPALAHRLAPYDGQITAQLSSTVLGDGTTPAVRPQADALARLALRQDPTAVVAFSTLGLNADIRGDKAGARRLFTDARKLSRRDLRTQLWMIEDAVGRGDVSQALHEYDITLRVFPNLSEMLYPVLASAISDPQIRGALVRTLAGKPMWGDSFINFVATQNPDPPATAAMFVALPRAGVTVSEKARTRAVDALIAAGRFDAAWSYYATVRPGADRRRSRDPRFVAELETPSQFDWMPINDGGLTTSIQGGIFDFFVPGSVGGTILQQLQLLPPGRYRLTGHSSGIDQPATARPYWALTCQGGREVGRVELPNSTVANGAFSGVVSVPADCPVQLLVLVGRPSDAVSGFSGQIDRAQLVPEVR